MDINHSPFLNDTDFFKSSLLDETGIMLKAGQHKYVKRTGTPGDYQYWYKDSNGQLRNKKDVNHNNQKEIIDNETKVFIRNAEKLLESGVKKNGKKMTDAEKEGIKKAIKDAKEKRGFKNEAESERNKNSKNRKQEIQNEVMTLKHKYKDNPTEYKKQYDKLVSEWNGLNKKEADKGSKKNKYESMSDEKLKIELSSHNVPSKGMSRNQMISDLTHIDMEKGKTKKDNNYYNLKEHSEKKIKELQTGNKSGNKKEEKKYYTKEGEEVSKDNIGTPESEGKSTKYKNIPKELDRFAEAIKNTKSPEEALKILREFKTTQAENKIFADHYAKDEKGNWVGAEISSKKFYNDVKGIKPSKEEQEKENKIKKEKEEVEKNDTEARKVKSSLQSYFETLKKKNDFDISQVITKFRGWFDIQKITPKNSEAIEKEGKEKIDALVKNFKKEKIDLSKLSDKELAEKVSKRIPYIDWSKKSREEIIKVIKREKLDKEAKG
jgi:hypothetical protein